MLVTVTPAAQGRQLVRFSLPLLPVACAVQDEEVTVTWEGGPIFTARLIAPPPVPAAMYPPAAPETEVVESNGLYRWERMVIPDPQYPRVIEVRADALRQSLRARKLA